MPIISGFVYFSVSCWTLSSFLFLQYAKLLILNYFFHPVACCFPSWKEAELNTTIKGLLLSLEKSPAFFIKRNENKFSVILCLHTCLIPWCSAKPNFQICNTSSGLWVWLIIIVSPLKWIMMIPKELVVNIINSWLSFQDINQKSKLLEMTRFPQMLLINKGTEVVWQWFPMLLSAWLYQL